MYLANLLQLKLSLQWLYVKYNIYYMQREIRGNLEDVDNAPI
jgi:hypothetical protein